MVPRFEPLEPRLVLDSTVVLNEIMYNPPGAGEQLEWVELHNQMAVDMDISGWRLDGGTRFSFVEGTVVPGGGYLVVAADPDTLRAATGFRAALGPLQGKLANGGERLELRNNSDRLMDAVDYDDNYPWPVAADGSGATLAKHNPNAASAAAENWTASAQVGGTPGSRNFFDQPAAERPVHQLVGPQTTAAVHVPGAADAALGTDWTELGFDTAGWTEGPFAVGFDADVPREQTVDLPVVRYYPLDGDGNDASGNGFQATVNGANFVDDIPFGAGQSLDFDGVSDRAVITDLANPPAFTLSAWVKPDQIREQSMVVRSLGSPFPFWTHQIRMTDTGLFEATAIDSTIRSVRGTTIAQAGQWYHVAMTVKNNGLLRLFVNGVEEGTPAAVGRLSSAGQEWLIGSEAGSGNIRYFDGKIDDVAVWHDLVSDENIAALAGGAAPAAVSAGPTLPAPALLHYYPLEGDASDQSGNNLDGTLRGPVAFSADVPPNLTSAQSIDLNGVDARFKVLDPQNPAGYTISAWVKFDSVRKTSIIARAGFLNVSSFSSNQLRVNESGQFEHNVFDGFRFNVITGTTVVQPDQWYHVVGTAQSNSVMRLYVNGVQEGSDKTIGQVWSNGDRWVLGTAYDRGSERLDGRIDDLALWSGPLSPAQVASLYQGDPPIDMTGYVGAIATNIEEAMVDRNASAWIRTEFEVLPGVSYDELTLDARYDDGLVVYLNGVQVATRNAPALPAWDASATAENPDASALVGEPFDLSSFAGLLRSGTNVLAIQGLNRTASDRDFLIDAQLRGRVATAITGQFPVAINEITSADAASFSIEIVNHGAEPIDLAGLVLASTESDGAEYVFPAQPALAAGAFLTLDQQTLGFGAGAGDRIFLYTPGMTAVLDGVRAASVPRARLPDASGRWQTPSAATPGAANRFAVQTDVVINEIMYHPRPIATATGLEQSAEEWIELTNRSATETVDLSGWKLGDAIDFEFPAGTTLGPGRFLVVAKDPAGLESEYPEVFPAAAVLGPFAKSLSDRGERLELVDAVGNVADEVRYYDDGRWPRSADGWGSSLELRDPDADNTKAEAWSASDESSRSEWRSYRYTGPGASIGGGPQQYHEFLFGLLDAGQLLLDDVSVVEDPGGPGARSLIQNGTFEADTVGSEPATWRIIGTQKGRVEVDPDDPSNQVLRLTATGPTEHMHNNAGTTLKDGDNFITLRNDLNYEISFRAKWLSGSNQLHTRLYFNRLARTTLVDVPERSGTPGQANSTLQANIGPTYEGLRHGPVVPDADQPVTVSVGAQDPDGVASMTLWYSVDGAPRVDLAMAPGAGGRYAATIPGQPAASVVQFYVQGQDGFGASSTFPAAGADSRALYVVQDGQAEPGNGHNFRIVMTAADTEFLHEPTNVMSNDRLGATVIYDEQEVFYDVGVRLKGSERGRNKRVRVGFNVRFDPQQLFRGVHETVAIDRSGAGDEFSQKEILVKHAINHAGQIPGMYDDITWVIAPKTELTGSALLSMARYNDVFLDSQYEAGGDGTAFEYELIYYPTTTVGGDVEGLKRPNPDNVVGVGVRGLGEDKEAYRWYWLIKNNRQEDDYTALMAAVTAMGQPAGPKFHEDTQRLLDVDQWLRAFAVQILFGIGDSYSTGSTHNMQVYTRPSDGKTIFLPWDMDFTFRSGPFASLTPNGDLVKLLTDPGNEHAYYGHLLDIIETTFNTQYMEPWIDHYSSLLPGEDFRQFLSFIQQRRQFVLDRMPDRAVFALTADEVVDVGDAPAATITGTGWIDVREIRLAGSDQPLDVTWDTVTSWQATVPVDRTVEQLTFEAYDFQGRPLGSDTVSVRSTAAPAPGPLVITEISYHPLAATQDELAANPNLDQDQFEFIELQNVGSEPLDLAGMSFTDGIDYTFPSFELEPGQFAVVVKDRAAFELRFGLEVPVVGEFSGQLRNSGERVELIDKGGQTVTALTYGDRPPWPAAADGMGPTLNRLAPELPAGLPGSWIAADPTPGAEVALVAGDADLNGIVNGQDVAAFVLAVRQPAVYRATYGVPAARTADADGDGDVDFDDIDDLLELIAANTVQSAAAAAAGKIPLSY